MNFKNLFNGKQTAGMAEAEINAQLEKFYAEIQENIKVEVKCMDAMSRLELINYNAETRVNAMAYIMQLQSQINTAFECIEMLSETNKELLAAVNSLICKRPAKKLSLEAIAHRVINVQAKK